MASVYSVAQVNSYIKNMFAQDFVMNRISVRGEISNCKYHPSGHIYFTMKDERDSESCDVCRTAQRAFFPAGGRAERGCDRSRGCI
ncbi:MAG: exodeoxyribonuclease VII large subunit [Lachnospiraceae bacterium]